MQSELYNDNEIIVTNNMVTAGEKTYFVKQITTKNLEIIRPSRFFPISFLLFSIIYFIGVIGSLDIIHPYFLLFNIILVAVSITLLKYGKKKYRLSIELQGKEYELITSKDEIRVNSISNAIAQAITGDQDSPPTNESSLDEIIDHKIDHKKDENDKVPTNDVEENDNLENAIMLFWNKLSEKSQIAISIIFIALMVLLVTVFDNGGNNENNIADINKIDFVGTWQVPFSVPEFFHPWKENREYQEREFYGKFYNFYTDREYEEIKKNIEQILLFELTLYEDGTYSRKLLSNLADLNMKTGWFEEFREQESKTYGIFFGDGGKWEFKKYYNDRSEKYEYVSISFDNYEGRYSTYLLRSDKGNYQKDRIVFWTTSENEFTWTKLMN